MSQSDFLVWMSKKLKTATDMISTLTLKALKYLCINHGDQSVFPIWNHHKCLSQLWFIWIPMLWVYDHWKYFYPFSAGSTLDVSRSRAVRVNIERCSNITSPPCQRLKFTEHIDCISMGSSSHTKQSVCAVYPFYEAIQSWVPSN